MTKGTTTHWVIDPERSSEFNLLSLINRSADLDLILATTSLTPNGPPDSNNPDIMEVTIASKNDYVSFPPHHLRYKRLPIEPIIESLGHMPWPMSGQVSDVIDYIERHAFIVAGEIEAVDDTLTWGQDVTIRVKDNSLLYYGEADLPLSFGSNQTSPHGGQTLMHGTPRAGYYGEISGDQLISSADLVDKVGIPGRSETGDSLREIVYSHDFVADNDWLKFIYRGRTLFVSKQILCEADIETMITEYNFEGPVIEIDGFYYQVRLLHSSARKSGAISDTGSHQIDIPDEWAELMFPVMGHKAMSHPTSDYFVGTDEMTERFYFNEWNRSSFEQWAMFDPEELDVGGVDVEGASIANSQTLTSGFQDSDNDQLTAKLWGGDQALSDNSSWIPGGDWLSLVYPTYRQVDEDFIPVYSKTMAGWRPVLEYLPNHQGA